MKEKPLVVFLVGPTASGKSNVAVELALLIKAEIISADSMQVYKNVNILNAKPPLYDRKKVKHYLIDILEPGQEYNVAAFCKQTRRLIRTIHKQGKIPLVAGGTGLYIKSLRQGIFEDKGKDEKLRQELYKLAEEKGNEFLYKKLLRIDKKTAEKIHQNDIRRLVRALEAYEVNKQKISDLKTKIEPLTKDYEVKVFGLKWDRKVLYERIEKRIDLMFEKGIIDEVRKLLSKGPSNTLKQALGIKQIKAYLDNECSLEQAKNLLKRDTRRFAKRQLTWFGQDENIVWIRADEQKTAQQIAQEIEGKLK